MPTAGKADTALAPATRVATAATEEERLRHTSQVQKIVAEDAVYIPLWSKENAVLLHPTLSDVTVNPRGDFQALTSLKRVPSP